MTVFSEKFTWKRFGEMTVTELHDILRLRCRVFIVEQRCAYEDVDGRDPEAHHLLARSLATDDLAGYLRCLIEPSGTIRIGRVVTAPEARSNGLGRRLMTEAIENLAQHYGGAVIELSAQAHLERFYTGFGFVRSSADYDEDGITHCDMRLAA